MQHLLTKWYSTHQRDLPWRHSHNPYFIWISEIMLQQTRVETVIPYYERFLEAFPTINDLAKAQQDDLYKVWQGLGYYSRVRNMQIAANQIMENYNGIFPESYEELEKLQGIGPYTSRAVASIAFNEHVSAIDGNALRIMSRVYEIDKNIQENATRRIIQELSDQLIVDVIPGDYNQAMMDLGSTICQVKNPKCTQCPIQTKCLSYIHHTVEKYPISIKKIKIKKENSIAGIITYQNKVFMIKNKKGVLKNLYAFPQYFVENIEDFITSFEQDYHLPLTSPKYLGHVNHVFTHKVWDIEVYQFELNLDHENLIENIEDYPISTCHLKIYKLKGI